MRVASIVSNMASSLFGPQYQDAIEEDVGIFEVFASKQLEVVYNSSGIKLSLLPPGGYVIKYVSGHYLLLNSNSTKFVVGGSSGLHVCWSSTLTSKWTTVEHPINDEKDEPKFDSHNLDSLIYLEFTTSHKMLLNPPSRAVGSVKLKIIRYIPRHLDRLTAENLVRP